MKKYKVLFAVCKNGTWYQSAWAVEAENKTDAESQLIRKISASQYDNFEIVGAIENEDTRISGQ